MMRMIFNSVGYLIFLPIVLLIYFIVPNKIKWIVLLTASYYFYMSWNPKYILLLLFFTVFNYLMALMIEKCKKNKQKKKYEINSKRFEELYMNTEKLINKFS